MNKKPVLKGARMSWIWNCGLAIHCSGLFFSLTCLIGSVWEWVLPSASKLDGKKHVSHHNLWLIFLSLWLIFLSNSMVLSMIMKPIMWYCKSSMHIRGNTVVLLCLVIEPKIEQCYMLAEVWLNYFWIWVPVGTSISWFYISLIAEHLPFTHIW